MAPLCASVANSGRLAAPNRSAAVAATRSACARAWVRTSALTRALRLMASGTPKATMANNST